MIKAAFDVLRDFVYPETAWTDDTQQALVLAEATIRFGRPDPEWVGRRFVEMSRRGPGRFGLHRGTGRGFRSAVREFERHGDWRRSGNPDRAGNGASMRIGPVAAALAHLPDEDFARAVAEVSMLTHREARALLAALAAGWVARTMASEPTYPLTTPRRDAVSAELVVWLEGRAEWLQSTYSDVLANADRMGELIDVLGLVFDRWDEGLDGWLATISAAATERRGEHTWPTEGYVLASVPAAISLALGSRGGYEETLVTAVNLGGDADTVGAMVGGMVGAATGLDAIPERWRSIAGYDAVLAWAEGLAGVRSIDQLPDLVDVEESLCRIVRGNG